MNEIDSESSPKLWDLPFGQPQIDPDRLANALQREAAHDDLDFRTRLLIRDSLRALHDFWGQSDFDEWLQRSSVREKLISIYRDVELGEAGFTTLGDRLMEATTRETVLRFLRELGTALTAPQEIFIGGAGALILLGMLSRHTDDVDLVDEVPSVLRNQHGLLETLGKSSGLRLAHFQSHYLPQGWRERVESMGRFGELDVFVVNAVDIFVSKLFSARQKDRDDLAFLARSIDRAAIRSRLLSAEALLSDSALRQNAEKNWYIVYGDTLPLVP